MKTTPVDAGDDDKFTKWLATPIPRKSPKCETCSITGPLGPNLARYALEANSGRPVPRINDLYLFIQTEYDYQLGYSTLRRHLKNCLGLTQRG